MAIVWRLKIVLVGKVARSIFTAAATTCAIAGCGGTHEVGDNDKDESVFTLHPVDFGIYRAQVLLPRLNSAGLHSGLLEIAEQKGRLLIHFRQGLLSKADYEEQSRVLQILIRNELDESLKRVQETLKSSFSQTLIDFDLKESPSRIYWRAKQALKQAEVKGMLDQMLDDRVITRERHGFISSRLNGVVGYTNDEYYLEHLKDEKKAVDKAFNEGLIDAETYAYFNTNEWFKLSIKAGDVEDLFDTIGVGLARGKINSELANKLAHAHDYELADTIAKLLIVGRLTHNDTSEILGKLNTWFNNPREESPWETLSFQQHYFERGVIIPTLARNAKEAGLISETQAQDLDEKIAASRSEFHIFCVLRDDVKSFYAALGIDKYRIEADQHFNINAPLPSYLFAGLPYAFTGNDYSSG